MNWALNTEILERAKQQGYTPRQAAFKMARSRVEEAMSYRSLCRLAGEVGAAHFSLSERNTKESTCSSFYV